MTRISFLIEQKNRPLRGRLQGEFARSGIAKTLLRGPFKCLTSRVDFTPWPSEYVRAFWWWGAELLVFTLRGALPPTAM